jgi:hypothetical protein
MVDEIRLSWNTLLPYIEELARVAQDRVQKQDMAQKQASEKALCVVTR